jgi:hypothetical protein
MDGDGPGTGRGEGISVKTDGPRSTSHDTITECEEQPDGTLGCEGKLQCVQVEVKCRKGSAKQKKSHSVNACLPLCDDTPTCKPFDDNMGLICTQYTTREKKISAKLTGKSAGTVPPTDLSRTVWQGVCHPTYGTSDVGSCPV